MNTKTIFKKPRVIIAAVVLALIVALTAVVVILASEKATFKGVQVAADGYINLRFHYTINDESVTKANVYIYDGDQGYLNHGEPVVVDLVTDDAGNTYFSVPLAAAQMGCDVTIVPLDENGTEIAERGSKNAPTWSVKEYADKVLADGSYSDEYHAGLKAIMNYGHYASEYFAVGNHVVENEGIYGRKTNPIIGMTKLLKSGEGPTWEVDPAYADVLEIEKITVALEDSVSIKVYYTYTGDSSTTGTLIEGNKYYVSIDNIGANQYTTDYSANLKIQVGAYTAATIKNASVIKCLEKMVGEESTKDLALALYNFYHWTSKSVAKDQATCAHFMHYEYVADGVTQPVCTYCGKTVNYQVSDEINYFSAPGQMINNWACADDNTWTGSGIGDKKYEFTNIQSENGFDFVRVYLAGNGSMIFGNGTVGYGLNSDVYNQFMNLNSQNNCINQLMDGQGIGRYIVLKVRTPGAASVELGFLNGSKVHNFTGNTRVSDEVGTDTWQVYVMDLNGSVIINSAATAFNAVFRGNTKGGQDAYVDIAYLAICDGLAEVNQLVGGETSIIETGIFWNTPANDIKHTIEGHTDHSSMMLGGITKDANGDTVYTYNCTNLCCSESTSKTVSKDVNYYSAPGQYVNHWNTSSDPAAATNFSHVEKTVLPHVSIDPDGTIYTRVYFNGSSGRVYMANGTAVAPNDYRGGGDSTPKVVDKLNTKPDGTTQGVGKFAVVKIRLEGTAGGDVRLEILSDTMDTMFNQYRWINRDGKFYTIVVDLPASMVNASTEKINIKIRHTGSAVAYFDIAYFGICDDWSEIANIVGSGNVIHYSDWSNSATTANKKFDGTCLNGCTERVVTTKDYSVATETLCYNNVTTTYKCNVASCPNYTAVKSTAAVGVAHKIGLTSMTKPNYVYSCTNAGCTADTASTVNVPENVNYYSAPGQQVNAYGTGNAASGMVGGGVALNNVIIDENGAYTRIYMWSSGIAAMANGTATPSANNHGEGKAPQDVLTGGLGKYIVFKIRTHGMNNVKFNVAVSTSVGGSRIAVGGIGSVSGGAYTIRTVAPTEFTTYVINVTPNTDATHVHAIIGHNSAPEAGAYLDLAYFAICDDYAEVAQLISGETSIQMIANPWNSGAATTYTNSADHECTGLKLISTTEEGDNIVRTYECPNPFCGKKHTVTTPKSVGFFSAPGNAVNIWGVGNSATDNANKKYLTDIRADADGTVYTKAHYLKGSRYLEIALSDGKALADVLEFSGAAASTNTATESLNGDKVGYVVFKIRSNGADAIAFGFRTDDSDGAIVNVASTFRRASTFPDLSDGEWHTYIIDYTQAWRNYDAATKVRVALGYLEAEYVTAENVSVDIAYAANCETLEEVWALVGDDESIMLNNSFVTTSTAGGTGYGWHDNASFKAFCGIAD